MEAKHVTAALEGRRGGPTPTTPGLTWGSPKGFSTEAAPVPQLPRSKPSDAGRPSSPQRAGDAAALGGAGTAPRAHSCSVGVSINGPITSFPFKSLINKTESKILHKRTLRKRAPAAATAVCVSAAEATCPRASAAPAHHQVQLMGDGGQALRLGSLGRGPPSPVSPCHPLGWVVSPGPPWSLTAGEGPGWPFLCSLAPPPCLSLHLLLCLSFVPPSLPLPAPFTPFTVHVESRLTIPPALKWSSPQNSTHSRNSAPVSGPREPGSRLTQHAGQDRRVTGRRQRAG